MSPSTTAPDPAAAAARPAAVPYPVNTLADSSGPTGPLAPRGGGPRAPRRGLIVDSRPSGSGR